MSGKKRRLDKYRRKLRELGFRRVWMDEHAETWQREFPLDEVMLDVQLWQSGRHRVGYWHRNLFNGDQGEAYGHQTTFPADFSSVKQMIVVMHQQRIDWLKREKRVELEIVRIWRETGKMPDRVEHRAAEVISVNEDRTDETSRDRNRSGNSRPVDKARDRPARRTSAVGRASRSAKRDPAAL